MTIKYSKADFTHLRGKFISFEGIDGSGKSTQTLLLHDYLLSQKLDVLLTREIGGSAASELIRDIVINSDLEPMSELLLIMAARSEHIHKAILPALEAGKIVISDRFVDSSFAYQAALGIHQELIYRLHDQLFNGLYPDITFFIDLNIEQANIRLNKRGNKDKFDSMDMSFHQKVRANYVDLTVIFPVRFKQIKADALSVEGLHKKILQQLIFDKSIH